MVIINMIFKVNNILFILLREFLKIKTLNNLCVKKSSSAQIDSLLVNYPPNIHSM